MAQLNQDQLYSTMLQTITAASQFPFVRVDREEFLRKQFKDDEHLETILKYGPQSVYQEESLRKRADQIINNMTNQTSLISFAAGMPSTPFTAAAAGTADIAQYFGYALNMAQQIAYLFGEDALFTDGKKQISEEDQYRIVAYLGVMLGAAGSASLLTKVSKRVGINLGKKVANKALTKTTWYPLLKKVGALIGTKITKKTVEKSISKLVPVIGGIVSGGLTYATFRPMGRKLADTFLSIANGEFSAENDLNFKEDFLKQQSESPEILEGEIL